MFSGDEYISRLYPYIDASFSSNPDRKGHTSIVIMWGNVILVVIRKKQKLVTKDSTELELVTLSDIMAKIDWIHEYTKEEGYQL